MSQAPSPTNRPDEGSSGIHQRIDSATKIISAATGLAGLVLGFFVLPAAGISSPTAPAPTVTVTKAVPGPTVTATMTAASTSSPSAVASPSRTGVVYLRDLDLLRDSFNPLHPGQGTMNGVSYDNAITGVSSNVGDGTKTYYNLGRGYKTLTGILGLDDNGLNDRTDVSIEADGKRLMFTHLTLGNAVPINLDVTGVLRLAVITSPGTSYGTNGPTVVFANGTLSK
ncbi:NPCBM/NEW2 domain-containing protein [Kitasatospora sp. NPDC101235]|uniref:NPCBM/NEW2 domain-containing protein n=1 Tax=Kitasatospora sp. NPDC101235 TaxID=3364101 RepID=UPI0038120BB6